MQASVRGVWFQGWLACLRKNSACRRRLDWLCMAVIVLSALTVPAAGRAQDLTIAVSRTSLSLPLYVAQARKFFADEGLSVQVRECLGGQRCLKMMFEGQAQLATTAEPTVMFNSFKRADFAILATFVTSAQDVKLVVRKSAGIASAKQLLAKRIATVDGTSAHYFLDAFLLFNGLDPRKVVRVSMGPEEIEQALKDKRVDAAAIWEPFAHQGLAALAADGLVLPSGRVYTETFNLVADRKFLAEREGDMVKLLRALERAESLIRDRPLEAQAILMQRLQVDHAFVDATWKQFNYRLSLEQSLISTMEGQARWAIREGHLPADSKAPNYLEFIRATALRIAVPAAAVLLK
jgi:ABC-type nitrate/sulfonate/bicarbonate transport system substrate-binding protein